MLLAIVYHFFSPQKYNNKKSILDYNSTIIFEAVELVIIIILIIYCIFYKCLINGLVLSGVFIEHLLQLHYCYRQNGGSLRNNITGLAYMILILYNIVKQKYIFILIWTLGLSVHIISYVSGKSFSSKLCLN